MGLNTLTNRSDGQVITESFFNDIHTAINGQFIGRNASGIPEAGQNLGTNALPWGTVFADTLIINGSALDTSQFTAPQNRLISGAVRSGSTRADFLDPNGAAASVNVLATATSLIVDVNGSTVEVLNDINVTGLTVAPSTNNTALVNDADAADQEYTREWGEKGAQKEYIDIDTVGSEISSRVGEYASFSINNGAETEYFYAFIESATRLSRIKRGFYVDSGQNPVNRIVFSDNDTITFLSTGYLFLEDNGTTIDVSYTQPKVQFVAPASPVTGDYWYDLDNQVWRRYSGSNFDIINRVFIGQVILDTTNCIGARSVQYYKAFNGRISIDVESTTTEIVQGKRIGQTASVNGVDVRFQTDFPEWNITTNLAGSADMYNATEQASTFYFLYLDEEGKTIISDISPYFEDEMQGYYHPHNTWRCVGKFYNDGSGDIKGAQSDKFNPEVTTAGLLKVAGGNGHGAVNTRIRRFTSIETDESIDITYTENANDGSEFTIEESGFYDISYADGGGNVGFDKGMSLNSNQLTTAISTITATHRLWYELQKITNAAGYSDSFSINRYFKKGDVIRAHSGGSLTATAIQYCFLEIKKTGY